MAQTKTTNKVLFDVIRDLKKLSNKTGQKVFGAVAEKLSAPASQKSQVNLSRIEKFANKDETIIVPGKVLGDGTLTKKVTIIGFSASEGAINKINAAGSKFVSIREFLDNKPTNKIRIIG